jgi:hypothetical protein
VYDRKSLRKPKNVDVSSVIKNLTSCIPKKQAVPKATARHRNKTKVPPSTLKSTVFLQNKIAGEGGDSDQPKSKMAFWILTKPKSKFWILTTKIENGDLDSDQTKN